jgi:hypothetical protein
MGAAGLDPATSQERSCLFALAFCKSDCVYQRPASESVRITVTMESAFDCNLGSLCFLKPCFGIDAQRGRAFVECCVADCCVTSSKADS